MQARLLPTLLAVACWLAGTPAYGASGSIEREFIRQAPKIFEYCRKKGYKTVGVLKFQVQGDDGRRSDNLGPINLALAQRLEAALILSVANTVTEPVVVLHDASATAAGIPDADHGTDKGRKALFAKAAFTPAWGKDDRVAADAFLTGTAAYAKDLQTVNVEILAFGSTSKQLDSVTTFEAPMRLRTLIESAGSFVLRGAINGRESKFVEEAIKARPTDEKTSPFRANDRPVELEVLYDGKVVPYEFKGGQAEIPEPREGQTVAFRLVRRDNTTKDKYGVVLMINGINTILMEKLPPEQCRRWVLDRDDPPYTVQGFHVSKDVRHKFRIASPAESAANEQKYGDNCGKITFVVFREHRAPKPETETPSEAARPLAERVENAELAEDEQLLLRGMPAGRADTLADLRQKMRGTSQTRLRSRDGGLIEAGAAERAKLTVVPFVDPGVVMSATISYYRKKGN